MIAILRKIGGTALILLGLGAVVGYIDGAMAVIGESDQGWLYWGLAILVPGILAILMGIGLLMWGRRDQGDR